MSNLIQKAMSFAISSHGPQVRKYTNEPYWKHLAEVVGILSAVEGVTEEMLAAAWLHDTVEDTGVSIDKISSMFGDEVARLVQGMTDVSQPEDGNRAQRKMLDREHLARGCGKIHTIKLADLISNTSSIATHDPIFAKIYIGEKRSLLEVLGGGDAYLLQLASRIIEATELSLGSSGSR